MSNEIATRDTDSWAPMLPAIHQLAEGVASTEFVPAALRGKKYAVIACVLAGREIGVGPMEALQKINVIDGKPSLSAELMRSLVLRAGHEIEFSTLTDSKVTIRGRRAGSETWTELSWTLDDAKRIGVASKGVWSKYPRAMLSARATSELCRLLFPDALGGISYTPEEIENLDAEPTAAASTKIARASKKAPEPVAETAPATTPEPEPEIIDAEVVEELPLEPPASAVDGVNMIGKGQAQRLGALMRVAGITDRDGAIDYCVGIIGRPIESRNDLTADEAATVIRALEKLVIELSRPEDAD